MRLVLRQVPPLVGEILSHRSRACRMGQAGYDRARDLFGWPRFIRTLEDVYDRVLDERISTPATPTRRAA